MYKTTLRGFIALCFTFAAPRAEDIFAQQLAPVAISIGVESGDTLREFARVTSAVQLSNGDIVVANSRTSQLRWFDATGKFIRIVGRPGQGPNEFGRSIAIFEAPGDTIVVLSNRRLHYIDRAGEFARRDTMLPTLHWFYDRVFVERMPIGASSDRLRGIAAGIPHQQNVHGRRAVPDRAGNLWLRTKSGSNGDTWTGFGAAGRVVGNVTLPHDFEVFQITPTGILGLDKDSLGVERVQIRSLSRAAVASAPPSATARPRYSPEDELKANESLFMNMKAVVRNAVTAQEGFFAEHARYTQSADSLRLRLPSGVTLHVVQADERGVWMVASHPSVRSTCMFSYGIVWTTGHVSCG
jgi:hypothetical protein